MKKRERQCGGFDPRHADIIQVLDKARSYFETFSACGDRRYKIAQYCILRKSPFMAPQAYATALAALERKAGKDADTAAIANAFASIWRKIDSSLFGLLGHRGVASLYQHSLLVAGRDHPWLASIYGGNQAPADLAAFQEVLLWQTRANALRGTSAFLHVFHELFASFVGPFMAEQLLCSVWDDPSIGATGTENSS